MDGIRIMMLMRMRTIDPPTASKFSYSMQQSCNSGWLSTILSRLRVGTLGGIRMKGGVGGQWGGEVGGCFVTCKHKQKKVKILLIKYLNLSINWLVSLDHLARGIGVVAT